MPNLVRAIATVICLALAACGGGGGGGGSGGDSAAPAPTPLPSQSVAGIWKGSLSTGPNTSDVTCLATEAGEGACIIYVSGTSTISSGVRAQVSVSNGNQLSGSGTQFTTPGYVLPDGSTIGDFTITGGTVSERNTIELTTEFDGITSVMSGNFDPLYDRGSSLDFVTAAYSGLEISRSLAPFSIDTNGYLFGQTFSGCEIEGQISVIDTSANVYDVTATAANCPGGLSGNLEGLAFAADSSVTNDVLVLGVFNDAAAILGMPKKIGGPFFQTAKLLASDGKAYDHFGSSIALDGDVLVASSVPNDEFGEHAGAIYVFSSIGPGTWTEQAKIGPSDAAAGDYFGSHIDIDGDTIIVHSPFNDNDNGDNAGAAYVFVSNSPQSWIEQAKLTPDDGFHGDRFGRPALSGNIAVLGASWDSVVASYSGSAYVFSRDAAGRWTQETQLLPLDGVERGYFGKSTAIDVNTAVVGSRHDYEGGGVYVYERDESSNWTHTTKLVPGAFQADFGFGSNVALDGQTLLVSAPHEDFGGAVYVYEKDATGIWSQQARLSPSDERTGGWRGGFGPADLDGDTAVIGSPLADNGRLGGTGAAYVFRRDSSGNWNEVVKITAIDSSNDDRFGASVEIEGNTIAIGSPEDGENGNKSGAVYFFRLTD